MSDPTARMLRLLSLLQTHRYWPGGELAERLEVSARTLRRDVDRLRDLGYPVDASRGVAGGYQLRAGGQLPPLLLTDDEAVAIAAGLHSAAASSVEGLHDTSLAALTKVVSLMPPRLRRRIEALGSQTQPAPAYGPRVDAESLITLAQGCRDSETVRFDYTARGGEATRRHVEPLRLVSHGQRWYLVAYCRDRHDWRSFRVDRTAAPELTGVRFRPRELPAADALAFVREGMREIPRRHDVRVRLDADVEAVRAAVGRWGEVSEVDGAVLLSMATDDLSWPLMVLGELDCDFTVLSPPELTEAVARVARRFAASAG
ncbi:MAG: helix-turn-helix transcriptional regulator [Nocardioides sp.]|uniref:helix-turn-helix transcriptional regulator n=1 Tax=Nocardioides sp. TaxID=35761 RepID=UPI003F0037B7